MENKGKNLEKTQIQGLLSYYLNREKNKTEPTVQDVHLDEDSLTAFVEGNLSERESQPIVNHLIDCSFCRHVTTELVKLADVLSEEPITQTAVTEKQPSKVSKILQSLFSSILETNDSVVFAHHETEEPNKKEKPEEL
jgi:hypothetical protein